MAPAIPFMMVAATVLTAASQVQQGEAAKAAGKAQEQAAEFEARQLAQAAGQERASSQREAAERRRQGDLAQSRALALAAGSGGGTGGSVIDTLSGIEEESELNALTALFEGEERAIGLETGAVGRRFEGASAAAAGQNRQSAAQIKAIGTVMEGGSTLFQRFGDKPTPA